MIESCIKKKKKPIKDIFGILGNLNINYILDNILLTMLNSFSAIMVLLYRRMSLVGNTCVQFNFNSFLKLYVCVRERQRERQRNERKQTAKLMHLGNRCLIVLFFQHFCNLNFSKWKTWKWKSFAWWPSN